MLATHTSDGKKINVTDTDTTNGNSPRKLLINCLIQDIIPVAIPPIDQTIVEYAAGSGDTFLCAPYNSLKRDRTTRTQSIST